MTSPQLGFHTTGKEVIEAFGPALAGKTVVITGPTPGSLGAATVETLASHPEHKPAHFILLGRSEQKTQPLIAKIRELSPTTSVTFIPVELTSLESIRTAASKISILNVQIDTLIANAGVMGVRDYTPSKDNIESQFAINYLSHFLLTNLLLSSFSPNARIINISSEGHAVESLQLLSTPSSTWTTESVRTSINFNDGKDYNLWMAYSQSKGAQVLHAVALSSRLASSSKYKGITINSLHPGQIMSTGLSSHLNADDISGIGPVFAQIGRPVPGLKTLEEGVSTGLTAMLNPRLEGVSGKYLNDCGVSEQAEWCKNVDTAEKLWRISELLVEQEFEI